jgi:hypothetical protein
LSGRAVKLFQTALLIPASTDPLVGGKYRYQDATVTSGRTYYYQLEDVELDGTSMRHGPMVVTALSAWRVDGRTGALLALGLGVAAVVTGVLLARGRGKSADSWAHGQDRADLSVKSAPYGYSSEK